MKEKKTFHLLDNTKAYKITSDDELYLLYNDFLGVYDDKVRDGKEVSEIDFETLKTIREFHTLIWEKLKGGVYFLEDFEKKH